MRVILFLLLATSAVAWPKITTNFLGIPLDVVTMSAPGANYIPTYDATTNTWKAAAGGGGGGGITTVNGGPGISATVAGTTATITNTGVTAINAGTNVTLTGPSGSPTITAAGPIAGTGISVAGTTVTNTGVTSALAGAGVGVSAATGDVTFTNTGVTSNIAGTGISVSGPTGSVTIGNTGVISVTAGTNVTLGGTAANPVINASSSGGTLNTTVNGGSTYNSAAALRINQGTNATVTQSFASTTQDVTVSSPAFGTTAGTVLQGNDPSTTNSRAPNGSAGGDLTGTYPSPTIAALAVTDAKVAAANKDGTAGTPSMRTLSNTGTTACAGNDSRLSDSRAPSGSAGGDLTGTYPNPTVAALAITDAKVAAANKDGTAGTPSMRTLGTGSTQAAAGNAVVSSAVAGTAISVSGATGAVTINNTGVTSNVAGTGISVSGGTGAVTITNGGVTSAVAGAGITVSGATGAVTIGNGGVTSAVAGSGITVSGATGAVTFSQKMRVNLMPGSFEGTGAASEPQLTGTKGTNSSWSFLAYNDTTLMDGRWVVGGAATTDYGGGSVTLRIRWYATAITGNVVWTVKTLSRAAGTVMDTAYDATNAHTVTSAAAGTTLQLVNSDITWTPIAGELTAASLYMVQIERTASSGSDTMTGNANVVSVTVVEN